MGEVREDQEQSSHRQEIVRQECEVFGGGGVGQREGHGEVQGTDRKRERNRTVSRSASR